jgi:hypothetical protein
MKYRVKVNRLLVEIKTDVALEIDKTSFLRKKGNARGQLYNQDTTFKSLEPPLKHSSTLD